MSDKKNVFDKLTDARVELQNRNLKKSGWNPFAKFNYYELGDILPTVNAINKEFGIVTMFSMDISNAQLKVVNVKDPEDFALFSIDTVKAETKGVDPVQRLGSTITYIKRYLYLNAYEITEGDTLDALPLEKEPTYATPTQIKKLKDLAQKAKATNERLKDKFGIKNMDKVEKDVCDKAIAELTEYLKDKKE